jgi:hypothetical protein
MADLVKDSNTGGGTSLIEAGKYIGIAVAAAFGLWAISRRA